MCANIFPTKITKNKTSKVYFVFIFLLLLLFIENIYSFPSIYIKSKRPWDILAIESNL